MKSTNKRKPSGKLSRFYCLTVARNWIFKKLSNKAANIIFTIYSSLINYEKGFFWFWFEQFLFHFFNLATFLRVRQLFSGNLIFLILKVAAMQLVSTCPPGNKGNKSISTCKQELPRSPPLENKREKYTARTWPGIAI